MYLRTYLTCLFSAVYSLLAAPYTNALKSSILSFSWVWVNFTGTLLHFRVLAMFQFFELSEYWGLWKLFQSYQVRNNTSYWFSLCFTRMQILIPLLFLSSSSLVTFCDPKESQGVTVLYPQQHCNTIFKIIFPSNSFDKGKFYILYFFIPSLMYIFI